MISSTFTIAFNFRVENTDLLVPLLADVEIHHSDTYYLIKNFRAGGPYAALMRDGPAPSRALTLIGAIKAP